VSVPEVRVANRSELAAQCDAERGSLRGRDGVRKSDAHHSRTRAKLAVMGASPTTYGWQSVTQVQTGGIYRFVVLAPPSWTNDDVQAYLDPSFGGKLGWDTKSVSTPPPDVVAALNAAHVVFPGGIVPNAWWVTAAWPGTPGTLPTDPQITYEQLMQYVQVPAGTANDSTDPNPTPDQYDQSGGAAPSGDAVAALFGFGALALGVWLLWTESKQRSGVPIHPQRAHANPIQTIAVSVNGRKVPFRIEDTGHEWKALADVKIGRRKTLIVGSGSTKAEALHAAIAKASSAFATADV
jgi:hypothetical protein